MKVVVTRTFKNEVKIKYEQGVLKVVANRFISMARLKRIIAENSEWIAKQKEKTLPNSNVNTNSVVSDSVRRSHDEINKELIKDFFSGRKTMVLGDIVTVEESIYAKTYLDGRVLYVSEKSCKNKADRLKAIKTYLRKVAALYLASEISDFGTNISLCPSKIQFKELPAYWINCADAGQKILTIDYRVTQLPQDLRTYLIAHAFAHFSNPAHDDNFANYLSNILPRYKDVERKLENYSFFKDI